MWDSDLHTLSLHTLLKKQVKGITTSFTLLQKKIRKFCLLAATLNCSSLHISS